MDAGTFLMAAVLGLPFLAMWTCGLVLGILYVPQLRLIFLATIPFVVWRWRVTRRTAVVRRRPANEPEPGAGRSI
jgi:hypothetical protein